MTQRRFNSILIPTITFILGIFVQAFFDEWLNSKNLVLLGSAVTISSLVIILIILKQMHKKFDNLDDKLTEIATRSGLKAEFIEDYPDGKSYIRSTQLIEKAQLGLMAVDTWKPFPGYLNSSSEEVKKERAKQYEAMKKQISLHLDNNSLFHRRIIQLPQEYKVKLLPFKIDPVFYNYLVKAAEAQERHPLSCLLRRTDTIINTHFIVVDRRYVIMPLLTYINDEAEARYGILLFDDTQGELVNYLESIFSILNARSKPIELQELLASNRN